VSRRVVLAILGAVAVGATALRLRARPTTADVRWVDEPEAAAELLRLLGEIDAVEPGRARPELLVEEGAAALRLQEVTPPPPGLHVPAWLPAGEWGWWIAADGNGEPCVWAARPLAKPAAVIAKCDAGWRVWEVLAAALPDRGACEHCTAEPCDEHGGDHSAEDPAADRTGWEGR